MSGSYHKTNHAWNLNRQEAFDLQAQLAGKVIQTPGIKIQNITTVAGVDTHYYQGDAIAAVALISEVEKTSSEPSSGHARKSNHYLYLSAMASVWRIAFESY